jgi:NAD(P)-dependent dehydrogenase (short-subunit alcohol dehydrogenase family)
VSGPLTGKAALVAGATRGAGRGTAVALGGGGRDHLLHRSRDQEAAFGVRPAGDVEETAELADGAGGEGIAVEVEHLQRSQVAALVQRIDAEQGRLDVLVDDIWGGERLAQWNTPVWEHDLERRLRMLRLAIDTHLITSHCALALLIRRPDCWRYMVEVQDAGRPADPTGYR